MIELSRHEMETILNFNAAEDRANCFTMDKTQIRRWKKILEEHDDVVLIREDEGLLEIEVPKSWVKVKPPRKMSEEQKRKAGERLNAMRKDRVLDL